MSGFSERSTIVGDDAHKSGSVCCAVVYEEIESRNRALKLCDDLVHTLWNDWDFEFSWWKFDYLGDAAIARVAAESALSSDITIFSARQGNLLPATVQNWVQDWSLRRAKGDGVLVALIGAPDHRGITPAHVYLRQMAGQAGMDYLPQLEDVEPLNRAITLEEIEARAHRNSSVLNDILDHPGISTRWGINE